jgi:hypothetical protein
MVGCEDSDLLDDGRDSLAHPDAHGCDPERRTAAAHLMRQGNHEARA